MEATQEKPKVLPRYQMADVLSFVGVPDDIYGGHALSGAKRELSLKAFARGEDTNAWTYWYANEYGPSTQIEDPNLIYWQVGYKPVPEVPNASA